MTARSVDFRLHTAVWVATVAWLALASGIARLHMGRAAARLSAAPVLTANGRSNATATRHQLRRRGECRPRVANATPVWLHGIVWSWELDVGDALDKEIWAESPT